MRGRRGAHLSNNLLFVAPISHDGYSPNYQQKDIICMNHIVVTYLGFVVAVLIITWAVVELSRRYSRTRHPLQRNASTPDRWVTLKPTLHDSDETSGTTENVGDNGDTGSTLNMPPSEPQTRAKQNGHYSQSKHPL